MINVATKKIMLQHNEDQKTDLCHDNGLLCCDIVEEVPEEECCNIPLFCRDIDRRRW